MSDAKGLLFEAGKEAGLPVGMMLQFRDVFKAFKREIIEVSGNSYISIITR